MFLSSYRKSAGFFPADFLFSQNGEVDSSNFLWYKKAGNARWKLLAYLSFAYI